MWFAALGTYQQNPWLIHLASKLLTKNNLHIWNLLDTEKNSILWDNGNIVPKKLRMKIWDYSFTYEDEEWSQANHPQRTKILPAINKMKNNDDRSQWWHRVNEREYFPDLELNDQLSNYLLTNGMAPRYALSVKEAYQNCLTVYPVENKPEPTTGGPLFLYYLLQKDKLIAIQHDVQTALRHTVCNVAYSMRTYLDSRSYDDRREHDEM